MFQRILIANRGEIAVRILRACRELGVDTVAVYSSADADALHVQLATQAVCIGPAKAADSYLNVDALLTVARQTGCDALHPGYGFLSENAEFAQRCADLELTFIGPSGDVIRTMGNKAAARALMQSHGVPVVPGSDGPVSTAQDAQAVAEAIGYPVLVKASAGGGGRGMRRVDRPEELVAKFEEARAEALACFGDGQLYLEKLILNPRHIEFQILADRHGAVSHLGERDCSIQRKNQKLVEESPSKALSPQLREAMGAAAVAAARAAGYENAGTIEFVLDQDGKFYFIEMNTRIRWSTRSPSWSPVWIWCGNSCALPPACPSPSRRRRYPSPGTPSSAGSTPRTPQPASAPVRGLRNSCIFPAAPACGWTPCSITATPSPPTTTRWSPRSSSTPPPAWRPSAGCAGRWRSWSSRAIPPPPTSAT